MSRNPSQETLLADLSLDILEKLSTYVHRSAVFLDDKFAEILHWHGGASMLLNFGATSIKEFSSFENGEANDRKGTFFISSPLVEDTFAVLKDIIVFSNFEQTTIITNIHPAMQAVVNFKPPTDEAAMEVASNLKMQINELMREKSGFEIASTCHMMYLPIVAIPILPLLFTIPSQSSLFPLLPTDITTLLDKHKLSFPSELSFEHLPKELQLKLKLLASSLDSVADILGLSEEIFAIGTTSNIIASELSTLPWARVRRKSSNRKASLLLIDRTLDVGNVVHHGFESTLDRMLDALPRLHQHSVDVCVDMMPVSSVTSNPDFTCLAPGCLSHNGDHKHSILLNAVALLKQKEITTEVNRRLVEALEREGLFEKTDQSSALDIMQHYVSLFKNQSSAINKHSALLQLSLAVHQGLRSGRSHALEKLIAIEKMILQSFSDTDDDVEDGGCQDNVVLKIFKEFDSSFATTGRLEDLLKLLIYAFTLDDRHICSLSSTEEHLLENKLVEMFMRAKTSGDYESSKLAEKCQTEAECTRFAQDAIHKLKGLATSKIHLQRYKHAVEPGSVTSPALHQPIIKQVVQDIIDPLKPDLVDISHKSTTFGDLIKSGFGFFRGSTKSRPDDNPLLILFVVGGVTASEVKQVKDALSRSKSQISVLVGGTTMLKSDDVLNLALLQDNLHGC